MSAESPPAQSSILDGNSFKMSDVDRLDEESRQLVERRASALGSSYRLFYKEPIHTERAEGCYIYGTDGRVYLDAYNNVASVGHANPVVVEAVRRQMSTLNTHTRYLQNGVVDYAERLLATFPTSIDKAMFTNSGSEANDLAIRVARLWTGGRGVVVTAEAYHGTTDLLASVSPAVGATFGGDPAVRVVPAPDPVEAERAGKPLDEWFAGLIDEAMTDLREKGIVPAAFLADSIFSSDGIFPDPRGFLRRAIDVVHAHGALFVSDEVQPGFGRTGDAFWGFQRHGVDADLVTTGKPMGNGYPVAALAGRAEVLDRFGREVPYFNTFGGSSGAIAAASAVLEVIHSEGLMGNASRVGATLKRGVAELTGAYPFIGAVRGVGLYVGVEIIDESGAPDAPLAGLILNEMRRQSVLISVAGPHNNVLKIRPPLVFGDAEVSLFLERFAVVLTSVAPSAEEVRG